MFKRFGKKQNKEKKQGAKKSKKKRKFVSMATCMPSMGMPVLQKYMQTPEEVRQQEMRRKEAIRKHLKISTPLTMFQRFPDLPKELQDEIWSLAGKPSPFSAWSASL